MRLHDPLEVWPPEDLDVLNIALQDEKVTSGAWMADAWQRHVLDARCGGYLWRELRRQRRKSGASSGHEVMLHEAMLRFPSAPLFGSQTKTGFQVQMRPFHQHTLRLLKSAHHDSEPVTKLFLIFNGLNEIDHLGFYYDLAGLLIDSAHESPNVACLIVPFPAHLTRYPLIGKYAEKPLQRFVSDPSDLFRQYLRFMVETQWLVSTVVPISDYPVASGIPLLEPHDELNKSRCNSDILAGAIYKAWKKIFDYSATRSVSELSEHDVLQSITVVRNLIGWSGNSAKITDRTTSEVLDRPQLHVIGYSLGGYLAQSVFFSWPYAIGSCTTLCSGGALTSLRPEKIIHEEEWRAITHGLKFDIESGMLEGRIAANPPANPGYVCGIPASTFTSHFQAFTDIFLQDPYGTYRHRVSEYAPRLFFVVGGNDPIVPARSVLDTSPPDGINMLEIAKLSHFIAMERGEEWADFWLPTIVNIIASLSDHCEHLLWATTWNEETSTAAKGADLEPAALKEHTTRFVLPDDADRENSEPLNSEQIQRAILRFVERLKEKLGFLLVMRNQVPVTLMGRKVLHRRGAVPHYGDLEIARYWARLQKQRMGMLDARERVAIVIPGRLNDWFSERLPILSYKHLPIVKELPDNQSSQEAIWKDFLDDWEAGGALYRFDAQPAEVSGDGFRLEALIREDTARPTGAFWILNCLPDVWISFSEAAVSRFGGGNDQREDILTALQKYTLRMYTESRKKRGEARTVEEEKARKVIDELLDDNELEILRISPAQSSPRYLGELVRDRAAAIDVLTHAALALARSTQCRERNDFAKGWTGGHTENEPLSGGAGSIGVSASSDDGWRFWKHGESSQPLQAPDVTTPVELEIACPGTDETVKKFGPFVVKLIGRGAMAEVYESIKDDRVIAIKCMSRQALRDPDNRRRFAQEAKVSLDLNHPNIVRVYDHGEIDGVPYLLMERLYGEPLKTSIDEHKRFAPLEAAQIAIQIAEALDYVHRCRVYHRDLKPGNIMMVDHGRTVKIMDFGIAVTPDTDRQTKTDMVIGTRRYMSPDRLMGGEATEQSDLYSLGLILFEMLTGQYAAEPWSRIANDHPRPSTIIPELPPPLDDIVAKLLARDGSTGYNSARQLLDDLKAFLGPGG